MSHASKTHGTPWRLYAACLGGAAILALLIYLGHWPHILQVLPLLLVAACPLMHCSCIDTGTTAHSGA